MWTVTPLDGRPFENLAVKQLRNGSCPQGLDARSSLNSFVVVTSDSGRGIIGSSSISISTLPLTYCCHALCGEC